jgi:MFS family permease
MIGGQIVGRWDAAFPDATAPFGLRGWQVAFFVVGLPGLLLALWVSTLREPIRGALDGIHTEAEPHPFRAAARELMAVLPPLTIWNLVRSGAGTRGVVWNLVAAAGIAIAAAALVAATGDTAQWVAMAVGLYATVSWTQGLGLRDRQSAALILGTPTLRWTAVGLGFLAFTGYGVGYWVTPFFLREHAIPVERAGLLLGGTAAAAGWLGVTLGGVLADAWRRRTPRGRLYVAMLGAVLPVPVLPWMLSTESTTLALALNVPLSMAGSIWIGSGASTVQELVLPRMRATASAAYLLVITFIGLALGPYTIGQLSDAIGLRSALLAGLGANAIALVCLVPAARRLVHDEKTLIERAQRAA